MAKVSDHSVTMEILIFTFVICVVITVFWLLIKCVSKLWCSLFCERETPVHLTPYIGGLGNYNLQPRYSYIKERARRVIAIDTESVGGPTGESMVARVSLVTPDGKVYDKYVKPLLTVRDYRTAYSGIREKDLIYAEDFTKVRWEVARLLKDCILVGHDIKHDLNSLALSHPAEDIRDTSEYAPFKKMIEDQIVEEEMRRKWMNISHYDADEMILREVQAITMAKKLTNPKPKLKLLAYRLLGRDIQIGEHSSVEDALAAMDLYLLVEAEWEVAKAYNYY